MIDHYPSTQIQLYIYYKSQWSHWVNQIGFKLQPHLQRVSTLKKQMIMGFKPIDGTMCEQGYWVKGIKGNFYVGYYVIFSTNSYNKNPKAEKHVDCSYMLVTRWFQ